MIIHISPPSTDNGQTFIRTNMDQLLIQGKKILLNQLKPLLVETRVQAFALVEFPADEFFSLS